MSFGFYVHGQRKDSADPASDEGIFYEGLASVSYLSFIFFHSTRHLCRIYLLFFSLLRPGFVPCTIFLAQYLVENSFLAFSISGILCLQFTVFGLSEVGFFANGHVK